MSSNQERPDKDQQPLTSDERTAQGKQEQVDYANNSHRDGHDNEDMEDLNSLKGELGTPGKDNPQGNNNTGE